MGDSAHFIQLLGGFRAGMFITHGVDGELHPRPMQLAEVQPDGTVWLMSDLTTQKVEELREDARASLTLQDGGRFVALSGKAELVRDPDRAERLWSEPWRVWFPKGPRDPNVALIKIVPSSGEYWDGKGVNGLRYLFEAARAYVAGDRPDLSEGQAGKVDLPRRSGPPGR